MKIGRQGLAGLMAGILCVSVYAVLAQAPDGGKPAGVRDGGVYNGPGAEKLRDFRRQQADQRRAFLDEQAKAGETFREGLKAMAPKDAVAALIKRHEELQAGNVQFMEKQQVALVEFLTKVMEEDKAPADKQRETLERLQARFDEMKKQATERDTRIMDMLKALGAKENLTREDVREALAKMRPEGRGPGGRPDGAGGAGPKKTAPDAAL